MVGSQKNIIIAAAYESFPLGNEIVDIYRFEPADRLALQKPIYKTYHPDGRRKTGRKLYEI